MAKTAALLVAGQIETPAALATAMADAVAKTVDAYEISPALWAAVVTKNGDTELVRRHIGEGLSADDICTSRGYRVFIHACWNGHTEIVRLLIGLGLTVDDIREFVLLENNTKLTASK